MPGVHKQGDQMSFQKIAQNFVQTNFWQKEYIIYTLEKKYHKNLGYFCDFLKKLPKVNNCPLGENSPNLVTLLTKNPRFMLSTEMSRNGHYLFPTFYPFVFPLFRTSVNYGQTTTWVNGTFSQLQLHMYVTSLLLPTNSHFLHDVMGNLLRTGPHQSSS
jgi:hypothetical protein